MKKFVKYGCRLIVLIIIAGHIYADDGGSGFSAASSSGGLGGGGDFNSINSTQSSGSAGATANVIVPPIVTGSNNANSNANQAANKQSNNPNQDLDRYTAYTNNTQNNNGRFYTSNDIDPFVRNSYIRTGITLNKFGSNLISIPSSYYPNQNIPVPANYVIGPGDQLQILANGAIEQDFSTEVRADGTIYIPKLGSVYVTGVRANELNTMLEQKLSKIYRNFTINAGVSKVRSIQVTVAGLANRPGTYMISSLSTLSNAIFAVGGPSEVGSFRDVLLKRNGRIVTHFDLYELLINGNPKGDVQLVSGDVIEFKPLGNEVAIYNGIIRPGIYEVKAHETIADVVKFAGGFNSEADSSHVVIETTDSDNMIQVNDYSWAHGRSIRAEKNSIIHFFVAQNKYVNTVAVIGSIANPSRFQYKEGMTVRDLIPNRDALLTSSYYDSAAYFTYGQDNALTQMRVEKVSRYNQSEGLNTSTGLATTNNTSNANQNVFDGGQNMFRAGPVVIPEANINWNYALIVRTDPKNFSSHIIPFNLRQAIDGNPRDNIKLMPGDVVNVLSTKVVRTPSAGSSLYVFIDGEVNAPGVYELKPGESIMDAIITAGGVTSKAYVFGMELNRQSVQKQQQAALNNMLDIAQQNLLAQASTSGLAVTNAAQAQNNQTMVTQQQAFIEKLRQIKPSGRVILNLGDSHAALDRLPNFGLENGDTIYIPPRPNVINIVGQVYNPGTFIYNDSLKVRNYINMAGDENQFADKSQEYVLRADGTLYSRQQAGWFGNFGGTALNPGDVIIVPQDINIGGGMQLALNMTQILANSAQTIALFGMNR